MKVYFAQFCPAEDKPGAYSVEFPDLDGCFTEGDNLQDAIENAKECLTGYLEACIANGEELPNASTVEEAKARSEQICNENGYCIPAGTFYQAVLSEKVSHLINERNRKE